MKSAGVLLLGLVVCFFGSTPALFADVTFPLGSGSAYLQLDVPFSADVAIYRNSPSPTMNKGHSLSGCNLGADCGHCEPEGIPYLVESRGRHRQLVLADVPVQDYEWVRIRVEQIIEEPGCATIRRCCNRTVRLKANDLKYVTITNQDLIVPESIGFISADDTRPVTGEVQPQSVILATADASDRAEVFRFVHEQPLSDLTATYFKGEPATVVWNSGLLNEIRIEHEQKYPSEWNNSLTEARLSFRLNWSDQEGGRHTKILPEPKKITFQSVRSDRGTHIRRGTVSIDDGDQEYFIKQVNNVLKTIEKSNKGFQIDVYADLQFVVNDRAESPVYTVESPITIKVEFKNGG